MIHRPGPPARRALPAVILALACALPAAAQTPPPAAPAQQPAPQTADELRREVEQLRQELSDLRDSYAARLQALEAKLSAVEAAAPAAAQAAPPTPAAPVTADATPPAPAQAPPGTPVPDVPPATGSAVPSSKVFNPDVSVIGNFVGAVGKNEIEPTPALQLQEAEATFQAVVDPYARADFFFSFSPEGAEIEEGYITLTSLPGGLLAKVGKFKQQVGKANTLHAHTLSWADEPLAIRNLLGGEEGLSDSGISVSKLIPNSLFFLEATGEVYQGSSGVFAAPNRSDVSWVGRVRGYRDISESSNLDIGTSVAYGTNDAGIGTDIDTHTRIMAFDATYRYRPLRRAIYRRFMGRTELFWSRREQLDDTPSAFGMYASADYQFARRWIGGARYDWSERAYDDALVDKGPSLLVTYWPSEFSQIRGQYRRTSYAEGPVANEFLFQFLFAIGAHGAHTF